MTLVAIVTGHMDGWDWLQVASPDNAMCRRRAYTQFPGNLAGAPSLRVKFPRFRAIYHQTRPAQVIGLALPCNLPIAASVGWVFFGPVERDPGTDALDHSIGSSYPGNEQAKVRVGDFVKMERILEILLGPLQQLQFLERRPIIGDLVLASAFATLVQAHRGKAAGSVKIQVGIEVPRIKLPQSLGVLARDVSVADVFAYHRTVASFMLILRWTILGRVGQIAVIRLELQ